MCVSHKISLLITQEIFSFSSVKLIDFSLWPIFNPGPSQCVHFSRICLSTNLTDPTKIISHWFNLAYCVQFKMYPCFEDYFLYALYSEETNPIAEMSWGMEINWDMRLTKLTNSLWKTWKTTEVGGSNFSLLKHIWGQARFYIR